MRRREIQNFSLKLSDLKEYELAKQERLARTSDERSGSGGAATTTIAGGSGLAADVDPMKTPEVTMPSLPKLGLGPKTKQEIRARIGFPPDLP
ncbi:uncharacterized protein LOC135710508 [Ochlerotatus camptorhynchus]|uniref:uncharacterized protein LOC135710508 n=1 Tax=Ochlerotatus camptorhynchus TaxID=644619 RepID=UPI0031D1D721